MGRSPLEAMQAAVREDPNLSEMSKRTYLGHLALLNSLVKGGTVTLFRSPERVFRLLKENYSSHFTRKQLMASLKAAISRVPAITAKFPTVAQAYKDLMAKDEEQSGTQRRILNGELSEREKKSWLPWKEVLEVQRREAAERPGEVDTLLISMYTLMEPLRQDFGDVRIVYSDAQAKSLPETQGFVQLDKADRTTGSLILRQYKTARKYGAFRRAIPAELVQEIWRSLDKNPREHLFGPYRNRNSFVQQTNRVFCRLFGGRRVTVNTLRHSFISGLDFNTKTPGELFRTSKMMAHGISMQQMYRRLPKEGEVEPDVAAPLRTKNTSSSAKPPAAPAAGATVTPAAAPAAALPPHPPPAAAAASPAPAPSAPLRPFVVIPPTAAKQERRAPQKQKPSDRLPRLLKLTI